MMSLQAWQRLPRVLSILLMALLVLSTLPVQTIPLVSAEATTQQTTVSFGGRIAFLPFFSKQYVPPTEPIPPQPPQPPALPDVEVTLSSNPNETVGRGNSLTYEFRARNRSRTNEVFGLSIALNFDGRLALTGSGFSSSRGDGVGSVQRLNQVTSQIVVVFGSIRPNETRTGRLIFRVDRNRFRDGDNLGARAYFSCLRNSAGCQSNTLKIQVGDSNSDRPKPGSKIQMAVEPDRGLPGTRHRFSTDRFQPGELVTTWLDTPRGNQSLNLTATADSRGRVAFELRTTGFAVGDYALVAFGKSSKITGQGRFRVQGPQGLALSRSMLPDAVAAPPVEPAADLLAAPAQLDAIYGSGGIAGRLTDPAGSPLDGVPVLAYTADGTLAESTESQASGLFLFPSGLPSGVYTLEIAPSLAFTTSLESFIDTLVPSVVVSEPNLTLLPTRVLQQGAPIRGKVSAGDSGAGLEDVPVVVSSGTSTATLEIVTVTYTDAEGNYSTEALPSGSYTVAVIPEDSGQNEPHGYSGQERTGVTVSPPSTTGGVNFSLTRRTAYEEDPVGQISGRVTGDGNGLVDALVLVSAVDGSLADIAVTDADGSYTTTPLDTGVYTLEVYTLFSSSPTTTEYIDGPTSPPTATVTAGAGTANINAQLTRGSGISGRVLGAPTGSLTQPVGLATVPVLAFDLASEELAAIGETDPTGAYTLTGLAAGTYSVYFVPTSASDPVALRYLDAVYGGGTNGTPVTVQPPLVTSDITATLQAGGQIAGKVTGQGLSAGLADVLVLVYSASDINTIFSYAVTAADGTYATPALPSGSYKLAFVPSFAEDETTAAFLPGFSGGASDLTGAQSISVSAPNTAGNVNVQLARGGQIRGTVTGADTGVGLSEVLVLVYSGTTSDTLVALTLTRIDGSYATPGLSFADGSNTYRLEFDPASASDPAVLEYAPRFLGGGTDLAASEVVSVTGAISVTDKNIALPLLP